VNSIHPKVALPTLAGLGITMIVVAIQQYAPRFSPSPDLTAAIMAFVGGLVGYWTPASTNAPQPSAPPVP
jgi:hypothetical protein